MGNDAYFIFLDIPQPKIHFVKRLQKDRKYPDKNTRDEIQKKNKCTTNKECDGKKKDMKNRKVN